jgi:hypothetical protein
MTLAPFAAIEARIATATVARLANVVVAREGEPPFGAEFDLVDVDPISAPSIIGDVQITYLATAATLYPGETVWINQQPYCVATDPVRNGHLLTAQLREVVA